MPKTNARADARVKKAISFLQKCPAMTVKEGMLIAGFSKKEIKDRAKQAWIYRRRLQRRIRMQASGRAKRVLVRGGLYVNILVTNHIIVYLSSQHLLQEKSRKKALWKVP
jgi:hypothetical protein